MQSLAKNHAYAGQRLKKMSSPRRRTFASFLKDRPPARNVGLRSGTVSLIVCVCVALIGTEAWQSHQVYRDNIRRNEIVTQNTARSMAEQAETTLVTADTIVASLVERVEAEGTGPEARTRLYHLITSLAAALPAIHEMGIMDSRGNAIVKSLVAHPVGLNYAERDYFRFHATHTDRGPLLGERIKSKVDGTINVTVTRRIDNPDGSFAGVVVTSVAMSFFQHLFDQVQAKSGGIISLFADDGTFLVRSPPMPEDVASWAVAGSGELGVQLRRHPDAGTVTFTSVVDGVRRRGAYSRLGLFPLTVLVAQSEWDIQSSWRTELRTHAIILGCVLIVVITLGRRAAKATRMLEQQALQDGLTGLPNRRAFDARLEQELRRAERSGQPLSVIMIDIDHFKAYNDYHGHFAGDECLRAVANTIRNCLRRASDFAARYGGEEIVVVLPGADAGQARAVAHAMRRSVRLLAAPQADHLGGVVTFSAGVATYWPGEAAGLRALLDDADAALYAAKAAGRDTIMP